MCKRREIMRAHNQLRRPHEAVARRPDPPQRSLSVVVQPHPLVRKAVEDHVDDGVSERDRRAPRAGLLGSGSEIERVRAEPTQLTVRVRAKPKCSWRRAGAVPGKISWAIAGSANPAASGSLLIAMRAAATDQSARSACSSAVSVIGVFAAKWAMSGANSRLQFVEPAAVASAAYLATDSPGKRLRRLKTAPLAGYRVHIAMHDLVLCACRSARRTGSSMTPRRRGPW